MARPDPRNQDDQAAIPVNRASTATSGIEVDANLWRARIEASASAKCVQDGLRAVVTRLPSTQSIHHPPPISAGSKHGPSICSPFEFGGTYALLMEHGNV